MKNDAFLCIDTPTGRATRYVTTRLAGMRLREAGAVQIEGYNAFRPLSEQALVALDAFRKDGSA